MQNMTVESCERKTLFLLLWRPVVRILDQGDDKAAHDDYIVAVFTGACTHAPLK
jgi:hypothetical protein